MMLKNFILTLLICFIAAKYYLIEAKGHHKPSCLGCSKLSKVDWKIVTFVLQKLQDPLGRCSVIPKKVSSFKKQVVRGTLYTFKYVVEHKTVQPDSTFYCQMANGKEEACHMEVMDVPWEQERYIQWDDRSCHKNHPKYIDE